MSLVKFIQNSMKDTAPIVDAFVGSDAEYWAQEIVDQFDLPKTMNFLVLGTKNSHEVTKNFGLSEIVLYILWNNPNKIVIEVQQRYWTAYNPDEPCWVLCQPGDGEVRRVFPGYNMVEVDPESYDWVPEVMMTVDVPLLDKSVDRSNAESYDFKAGLMKVFHYFADKENICKIPGCNSYNTKNGKYGGYCQQCLKTYNINPCRRCGHHFGFMDIKSGCHQKCAARNIFEEKQFDTYLDQEVKKVEMGL